MRSPQRPTGRPAHPSLAAFGVMSMPSHHIECRTPETDSGATDTTGRVIRIPAGPWTRDEAAIGPAALYTYDRQEEAEARAASLATEHSEWEWRAVAD